MCGVLLAAFPLVVSSVVSFLVGRTESGTQFVFFSGVGIRRSNLAGNDVLRCPDVDPLSHHLCLNNFFFFCRLSTFKRGSGSVEVDESTGDTVNPGDGGMLLAAQKSALLLESLRCKLEKFTRSFKA